MRPRFLGTFALAGLILTASVAAQVDVASVKPSPPPPGNPFGFPTRAEIRIEPGPTVHATQATLRDLVLRAYRLQPYQLEGGPDWATSARFDIVARTDLRELLIDRFKLRVRTETRAGDVYHLVSARPGAVLGPGLRPSTSDCSTPRPECDLAIDANPRGGSITVKFQGRSMPEIARLLIGPDTGRPVLDRTGIAGRFDGVLTHAAAALPGFPRPPANDNVVSLFTALQEQFGLKLEPARGPIEVLVVDSAERPAAD